MSIYGIFLSVAFLTGTAAFPRNTPNAYFTIGTVESCVIQGVMVQFSVAIPLYYGSLSIYCFLAIRADFKESKIRWIEPWIHGTIHVITVIPSIILVITNNLNPSGPLCWIEASPPKCTKEKNIPCVRGDGDQADLLLLIFIGIPIYSMILVSILMMILIYRTHHSRADIKNASRKQIMKEQHRKRKTRIIIIQAALYLSAFLVSFSLPIITRTSMHFNLPTVYDMRTIGACLAALQCFFFTAVYFGLQIQKERLDKMTVTYISQLKMRLSRSQHLKKSASKNSSENSSQSEKKESKRLSFSIFDGTEISCSPWKMFLIEDGNESDLRSEDIKDVHAGDEENVASISEEASNVAENLTRQDKEDHVIEREINPYF